MSRTASGWWRLASVGPARLIRQISGLNVAAARAQDRTQVEILGRFGAHAVGAALQVLGHVGLGGWWLFGLVMLWTPAHFWALALLLKEDYRSVGIPMLPVVKGTEVTAVAIGHYARATVLVSLLGVLALPSGGWLYGLLVIPFNGRLLQMAHSLGLSPDEVAPARGLFRWSILYLFGICLLLLMARLPGAEVFSLQIGEWLAGLNPPSAAF